MFRLLWAIIRHKLQDLLFLQFLSYNFFELLHYKSELLPIWVAVDKHIVSVGLLKSSYSEKWSVHVTGKWKQEGDRGGGGINKESKKKKVVKWNTQICNQT